MALEFHSTGKCDAKFRISVIEKKTSHYFYDRVWNILFEKKNTSEMSFVFL